MILIRRRRRPYDDDDDIPSGGDQYVIFNGPPAEGEPGFVGPPLPQPQPGGAGGILGNIIGAGGIGAGALGAAAGIGGAGQNIVQGLNAVAAGPLALQNLAAGSARVLSNIVSALSPLSSVATELARNIGAIPFPKVPEFTGGDVNVPLPARTLPTEDQRGVRSLNILTPTIRRSLPGQPLSTQDTGGIGQPQ